MRHRGAVSIGDKGLHLCECGHSQQRVVAAKPEACPVCHIGQMIPWRQFEEEKALRQALRAQEIVARKERERAEIEAAVDRASRSGEMVLRAADGSSVQSFKIPRHLKLKRRPRR